MSYNQDSTSSNIKFTPSRDNNYSSSTDVGTKPTGDPRSGKDFKKVLGKKGEKEESNQKTDDIDEDGSQEVAVKDLQEEPSKPVNAPVSVFDLSRNQKTQPKNVAMREAGPEQIKDPESPSALFSKLSSKDSKTSTPVANENVNALEPRKEKFTTRFTPEQADLSYINPLGAPQQVNAVSFTSEKGIAPVTNMQDLIDKIVDTMKIMRTDGRTDTTVTIKYPPLFEGANIVVTGFDSAKGEFNIAFHNLTQAAKDILDQRINQESLRLNLEQKGYAVHIITVTTTQIENPILAEEKRSFYGQQEGRGGQQQQREKEEERNG